MKRQRNKSGFTLIEVLVVVLIIGILTSVAMPQYQKAVWKSRAAQIIPVVKTLGEAEQVYFATYNTYTTNIDDLDVSVPHPTGYDEFKNYWTIHLQAVKTHDEVYAEIDRWGKHHFYIRYYLPDGIMECFPEYSNPGGHAVCKSLSSEAAYSCPGLLGQQGFQCYRI